ncbi:MAG: hypothetical protein ACI33J_00010 [Clostridium sp.]
MNKFVCMMTVVALTSGVLVNSTFAESQASSNDLLSDIKVDQVLEQSGYDADTLEEMESKDKREIAEAINKNPDLVDVNFSIMDIDNLSMLEYFTNTDDSLLFEDGFSADDVKQIRNNLKQINSLNEKEMKERYHVSSPEYKMIKKSLEKNPNYKVKKDNGDKEVTTSGSIATSKMSFAMTKVNNSTSSAPSYSMTVTYNWKTPYFVDTFSDYIGVSWGGGLNSKSISSTAKYYSGNWYTGKYTTLKNTKSWSKTETPNKGIVFSTKQSNTSATQQNKTGTIKFTLYQTKFKGYDTKVLSQFAHKILAVSGITISGSPSITIGTGYDKSAQKSSTIRY